MNGYAYLFEFLKGLYKKYPGALWCMERGGQCGSDVWVNLPQLSINRLVWVHYGSLSPSVIGEAM